MLLVAIDWEVIQKQKQEMAQTFLANCGMKLYCHSLSCQCDHVILDYKSTRAFGGITVAPRELTFSSLWSNLTLLVTKTAISSHSL